MISENSVTQWRNRADWPEDYQVEQDLILHRIVSSIFSDDFLSEKLAFRGGTALNMLFMPKAFRYSEDCDLVQITAEPIGKTIDRMRELIDPWLGKPSYARKQGRFTLYYKYIAEGSDNTYKVKVEINTREHFSVLGYTSRELEYTNDWHSARCSVTTYQLEELLGTKLRALFQRKKGRDFFDLCLCLDLFSLDVAHIIHCFKQYMTFLGITVSRAELERNIYQKLTDNNFLYDITALLPKDMDYLQKLRDYKQLFYTNIIQNMTGEPWKEGFASLTLEA